MMVTLKPNESVEFAVRCRAGVLQKHLKSVFNMTVTLEQLGTDIDHLEGVGSVMSLAQHHRGRSQQIGILLLVPPPLPAFPSLSIPQPGH